MRYLSFVFIFSILLSATFLGGVFIGPKLITPPIKVPTLNTIPSVKQQSAPISPIPISSSSLRYTYKFPTMNIKTISFETPPSWIIIDDSPAPEGGVTITLRAFAENQDGVKVRAPFRVGCMFIPQITQKYADEQRVNGCDDLGSTSVTVAGRIGKKCTSSTPIGEFISVFVNLNDSAYCKFSTNELGSMTSEQKTIFNSIVQSVLFTE